MSDRRASLDTLYTDRFPEKEHSRRLAIWREIGAFLQRWVDPARPVLDVATGDGVFIANIHGSERWATDMRDTSGTLPDGVRFVLGSSLELRETVPLGHFGTVFTSNFLEHLNDRDEVIEQVRVFRDLLAEGGRVIVLQPNIRFTGPAYWDFIDHRVPMTDRSLAEAGSLAGLRTVKLIPRFLPYTTKGRLPSSAPLVGAYLRIPLAWRLLGSQSLYVGEAAR